jgi:hypothetical protein
MEEIARRRPIDRTAARVTQPGPKYLDPNKSPSSAYGTQPAPWPLRPVPHTLKQDCTGLVVGSLTVIGLSHVMAGHASGSSGKRVRWCCRCACGYFVLRKGEALRNAANRLDACDRCLHRQHLQRQQQRILSGEYVPQRSGLSALAPDAVPESSGTPPRVNTSSS